MLEKIISGEWQEGKSHSDYFYKEIAPKVTCKDGTTLSVQSSRFHYCTPRNDRGPYNTVEVGFPSVAPPETWAKYYDGEWTPENATESVYGYVPVEMVREFVESHGGEVESETK